MPLAEKLEEMFFKHHKISRTNFQKYLDNQEKIDQLLGYDEDDLDTMIELMESDGSEAQEPAPRKKPGRKPGSTNRPKKAEKVAKGKKGNSFGRWGSAGKPQDAAECRDRLKTAEKPGLIKTLEKLLASFEKEEKPKAKKAKLHAVEGGKDFGPEGKPKNIDAAIKASAKHNIPKRVRKNLKALIAEFKARGQVSSKEKARQFARKVGKTLHEGSERTDSEQSAPRHAAR